MEKYVYDFNEGNKDMREILGGKGANLAEMTKMGLPVPHGFTISTDSCRLYLEKKELPEFLMDEIFAHVENLEKITGKKLGGDNPLLLSVRSGAKNSMPGMMDSILNLGINDDVAKTLISLTDNKRFVYDSYRRFIQMFGEVVMGIEAKAFEDEIDKYKENKSVKIDTELDADDLENITNIFKNIYKDNLGSDFPSSAREQLTLAATAVFKSWNNERAIIYRKMNNIDEGSGTAVNVQEMVYGNMGEDSGTGVAFSRNPVTGENTLYGDYLINAQGEDVVAGVRTPHDIKTLKDVMPDIYEEFLDIAKKLEDRYKDMQDMEFTIENGKLYILQTRNGKRTGRAAIKIVTSLVNEKVIDIEEAIRRIDTDMIEQLLHPSFDEDEIKNADVLTTGVAASPGAACGRVYLSLDKLKEAKDMGEKVILVRSETSPEDIKAMTLAEGIMTIRGGKTSHAAVVARGMGKCCVSGCGDVKIHLDKIEFPNTTIKEGEYISLDGSTGRVYKGVINMTDASISEEFKLFLSWTKKIKKLGVRANADNERDALVALKFGAEGIGLCRSEHMFFDKDRIFSFRKMILAGSAKDRANALLEILPYQRDDYEKLFRVMDGKEVIIRYLDPPLHEFLPKTDEEVEELAKGLNISLNMVNEKINELKEFNPMMGHRGCRLLITYPEIIEMQTRAVIEAATLATKSGVKVKPEIMIPLVGDVREFVYVRDIVKSLADKLIEKSGVNISYKIGTMIEVPRAALCSKQIASEADFFSYGTNDLTQMTFGYSRDDSSKFLNDYYAKNILDGDPFASIDEDGVGVLIDLSSRLARSEKEDISLGICGEHGGDEKSIYLCHRLGLNYVSCSSYRVPIAMLAAAKAALL